MSKIADSIKENLEHIKAALPDGIDFDGDAYTSIAESKLKKLDDDAEKSAIIEELTNNPDVDQDACIADLEAAPDAHKAPPPATAKEQESAMKEMLAEREAEQKD